ncbi:MULTISPECIES: GntR family transcriptional regulator [unclassified Mesorhizobium]|uniref:GntR family transcriptional regulator n=1 Tax=unclassified Mesorhizobium TaxID=325217 RepID=UPI001126F801|nr:MULTISPECIES: GntR family transcriptional regulator [unclassified Mesorhizobium]TPJ45485.1 GntR family transcriptional regulator [Mesorhizobium sp. B2-6-6]MBZ9702383.1 GntR family transcriptional regulator [Mesorhizobium sp. CO1-1-3]MBZ9894823.1 GntR family transcriptional regulator [Mesorhizobium sp. BR1-1-6]MBZ9916510.1 GntR family transcriptional regulator [Mesorhizobium sp. BR1-1-7]MBZ9948902.1 GntR family transcriptional regulator [Mesorhizobium sp. BR1-1-11]
MAKGTDDTIAVRIGKVLADRIISGAIEPGARLRQDHVAEEFNTSHVPVREAFRRLEAQGLAVSEPRRGVRVAAFDLGEVKEVAEMRAALEVLALRHAAPHLTSAILDRAEEASKAGDKSRDVRSWEEANRAFHRLILTPCGMSRLLATIDDLHAASARFLFAAWRSEWETRTDQDHRAILAALRQGNTESAAATLGRHVQWIGRKPVRTASGTTREAFAIVG